MLCDNLEKWDGGWGEREAPEGEDTCAHRADSLHCTAQANTTL